jgi:hypothetical protein
MDFGGKGDVNIQRNGIIIQNQIVTRDVIF